MLYLDGNIVFILTSNICIVNEYELQLKMQDNSY